jgi:uncharacterized protein (TIGR02284 family)
MAMTTERTTLNHLIERCTDAARGFQTAADLVSAPDLKTVLLTMAEQHEAFAKSLVPHAQRLGGAATSDGTTAAALHRTWMDLKNRMTRDDQAILLEAERGQGFTVRAYADAVNSVLPPASRELIEEQFAEVLRSHNRLQELLASRAA